MFRDNVEELRALGEHLQKKSPQTLRGEGESWRSYEEAEPFLDVVEVFQADIHRLGIEGIMKEAALVAPSGGKVAPHCFASHLGFFTSLQIGAAIGNYYMAEQDVAFSRVIDSGDYTVKDGLARVPDAPGLGLGVVDAVLAEIEPVAVAGL